MKWERCIRSPWLLWPGTNETLYVGRKRNNELCCPTVLMVLRCCVGVTSRYLWISSGMISKESQGHHSLYLCSRVKVFWGDVSEWLTGNAFSVLYKCKEKTKPKKPMENVIGGVREGSVCFFPYVALPPLLELCAVRNRQSAEVQGTP